MGPYFRRAGRGSRAERCVTPAPRLPPRLCAQPSNPPAQFLDFPHTTVRSPPSPQGQVSPQEALPAAPRPPAAHGRVAGLRARPRHPGTARGGRARRRAAPELLGAAGRRGWGRPGSAAAGRLRAGSGPAAGCSPLRVLPLAAALPPRRQRRRAGGGRSEQPVV